MILRGLTQLVENADADPDNDAQAILILTYDIVSAYLRCLAANQIITIGFDDLETALINFETQHGLQGTVMAPDMFFKTPKNNDDLPEWRAYVAQNINSYTNDWLQAYFESPAWQHQTTGITSDLLTFIFTTLAEKAYDSYRKTPKSWTKKAITGVLTGYFVSNTDLTKKECQQVAPALSEFLTFVASQGWLNEKRASDYQRFITAAAPAMIAKAGDQKNAGPAKLVSAALKAANVDLKDEAAVQRFIKQINDNGGIDSLYDDDLPAEADDTDIPDNLMDLLAQPQQMAAVATTYDPDPDQDYLRDAHHSVSEGWREAKAIKTHALAVETGLRLWLQRQEYNISKGWESTDLIIAVVDFMDVLYAQNLVMPSQWSVSVFNEIGHWFRNEQSADDYQKMQPVIAGIVGVLRTTEILTKKQAGQLPAAFNGEPIPVIDKPKKVTGKVMSMKQARKLLKNKKRRR